jgi:ATP-dependent helicase/nuclease subunit A
MEPDRVIRKRKDITPTPEQQQAADPARSIWVSANAGSGKTHVLVNRVIRLMLAKARPEEILCLTFTKAAAAEMQNRLFRQLSAWTLLSDDKLREQLTLIDVRVDDEILVEARQLFTRALETPGGLKIQTIHAFAEKLLQLFPVESGIAPNFEVLDDLKTADMLRDARQDVLRLAQSDEGSPLDVALQTVERFAAETRFESLLKSVLGMKDKLERHIPQGSALADIRALIAVQLGLDPSHSTMDCLAAMNAIDFETYQRVASELKGVKPHSNHDVAARLRDCTPALWNQERHTVLLQLFLTKKTSSVRKLYSIDTGKKNPAQAAWLDQEQQRVVEHLVRHDLHVRADATASLLFLASTMVSAFERRKKASGAYDFADLIGRAQKLLSSSAMAQWVLYKLDRAIAHILVDEAQDTSPDQWSIIRSISGEFYSGAGTPRERPRTLFVVGDQKQSIYSFQGANAAVFEHVRADIMKEIVEAQQPDPDISLLTSYRSVPEVLKFVDAVFPPAAYAAMGIRSDTTEPREHYSSRTKEHGRVEIWPLVESEEPEEPELWTVPVDARPDGHHRKRLAALIAHKIKGWIDSGRMIAALDRPVQLSDILILVQRRTAIAPLLIAALRREGIAVAGADRLKLLESLSVKDLLAIIQMINLPSDDYSLAAVLKSPFVPAPLDDHDLEVLAVGRGSQTLWSRLANAADTKSIDNTAEISIWRSLAPGLGPYEFLSRILARKRKAMLRRLGPESIDATDALIDLALDYDQEQGASLAGFKTWIEANEVTLKREMEKGAGQVRIMTVHGAKGLESEIVILADTADEKFPDTSGLLLTDEGVPIWTVTGLVGSDLIDKLKGNAKALVLEEHKRLLYVAMTRAKDELYIAGSLPSILSEKEKPLLKQDSWYAFIEQQLPKQDAVQLQIDEDRNKYFGMRGSPGGQAGEKTRSDRVTLRAWTETPVLAPARQGRRSFTSILQKAEPSKTGASSGGAAFGTKVHQFLRYLPDQAEVEKAQAVILLAKRLQLDLNYAQRLALRIQEPDIAPWFAAGSIAEIELFATLPSGESVAGRVDRFRMTDQAFFLIDYKSDANPPSVLTEDDFAVQQISLYAQSLAEMYPDLAARVALFWTQTGRLDSLDPGLMTRACDRALQAAGSA